MKTVKKGNKIPYNGTLLNQTETKQYKAFLENIDTLKEVQQYFKQKRKQTYNNWD